MNDSVVGNHCCIAQNGNKIDCAIDEERTLFFLNYNKNKREVNLNVKSTFSDSLGTVSIAIDKNILIWKLITPPHGEYYLPKYARLHKNKKAGF